MEITTAKQVIIIKKKPRQFKKQIIRTDILSNMLSHKQLSGEKLFELLMTDGNSSITRDETRQGWIFESIVQIVILLKCMTGLHYTEICDGQLQNLKSVTNADQLLRVKVCGGGNNIVDLAMKQHQTLVVFSVKYKNRFAETDVATINDTIVTQALSTDYKIGLVVKHKGLYQQHKYKNDLNIKKQLHDTIIANQLLFDEVDVINALDIFCRQYSENKMEIHDFIDYINAECLSSPRKQLQLKLHQQMTLRRFINNTKHTLWCIAHKPRSGKSITILSICKHLLNSGKKKILIMTAVPATIQSFIEDLENYNDFSRITYKTQNEFDELDSRFEGIVFCSVQFLKKDGKLKKKELLQKIGFDIMIIDESHQGSSTLRTKSEILDVECNDMQSAIVEDIRKTIKYNIFASGTADKTRKYYGIPASATCEWEIEDEAYMKSLQKDTQNVEIIDYMTARHGKEFTECLSDKMLNQDYSKYPTQVLMKHSIPETLIKEIDEYNAKYGTKYGYSCSSLFALKQTVNEKGEADYAEEFELCRDSDGEAILQSFFECIISNNRMNQTTIFKQVERTQTNYASRKSGVGEPRLFILYLPTNTRNSTISALQKTLKSFLEKHQLWIDYNIEYSSSNDDSNSVKESYNDFIHSIMQRTVNAKKRGCILLLGNKGGVGITYHDCDVTISLDDGHNLDNQKQRFSRALTESEGKTIGINVDMNIQRTYLYLIDVIQKHRRITKTDKTNAEILYYLFQQNVFLFDPQQINNGKLTSVEIKKYYQTVAENIIKEIDDTPFLEHLVCDDSMREFIKTDFHNKLVVIKATINPDLFGEQPNCPKGDKTKTQIDAPTNTGIETKEEVLPEDIEILINQTYEMCKSFLFPLLALISRSYRIFDFKQIFLDSNTKSLIIALLRNKKIDLGHDNYYIIVNIMNDIIDNNEEIVNNIREIYSIAPSHKVRDLIEKHFIPNANEKKENAEVPTPKTLVDDMVKKAPEDFWKTPHRVFEPCCGKGNFVLGIFDMFYRGLETAIPDEIERCQTIMTECIYYADLTALNVFITTEILKCHIQHYCGLDELDYDFHSHVGNTLELDIRSKWSIDGFHAVTGNPPYNSSGDTGTGNTIWQDFTKNALQHWLLPDGYLLFVHPPGWRKPNTDRGKFARMFELMTKENQMIYLEIHGIKDGQKTFHCGTRYDWYLMQKTRQTKNTIVSDENRVVKEFDLSKMDWLPNSNVSEIQNLMVKSASESKCPIMQSMSAYEPRKKWMSSTKTSEFQYPCVHSTPKSGLNCQYSNVNNRGHFGIAKVIFGDGGIQNPIIDMEGKYGMTHHSMGIQIESQEEGENICKALKSAKFNENIIHSCLFSTYAVDWNIFKDFRKDFWKDFM